MTIRFAILAGVSTDAQAGDKLSIPDQIKFCRAKIAQLKGLEAAGPFVMDGYSRSGYDSLELAMTEIPPLGAAIRAAHADQYDVLLMDNFDRLGDLGILCGIRFKKLRKQLYSARQSGALADPATYDPYASEEASINMHVQGIIQTYRINKIRRGWNVGVPGRASAGLHPLSVTYGYKLSLKGEPAQPVPEELDLVRQMKDWFLQGIPLQQICDRADASGIHPRRAAGWQRWVVKRMLLNPYYAGVTVFGRYRKRIPVPPSQWVTGQGKHQPLWDQATYLAILAEMDRRAGLRSRGQVYTLTGLLVCSVCGLRLHRHGKQNYHYMDCTDLHPHIRIRYEIALTLAARAVIDALRAQNGFSISTDTSDRFSAQMASQEALRLRIQEGFEAKLYTAVEAQKRIVSVETEMDRLVRQHDRLARQQEQKKALLAFAGQDLERMYAWILEDDPTTVNHLLTSLCEKIVITPDRVCRVEWRI